MIKELTLELTDYCPHECSFCSSCGGPTGITYLEVMRARELIHEYDPKIIHISGGEPLASPYFWQISGAAIQHVGGRNVRFLTNRIQWLGYNPYVIPGVRVEANLTVEDGLNRVNILKRVPQGREAEQPVVKFSRNYKGDCLIDCSHKVVRPDGTMADAPCRKYREPTKGEGKC